ncbi:MULTISPECIES: F0F1 ATP synthase subunit delta [unclassified Helicobacter]|uniref:F0F1 ATP synthase subunit delta n=1 Tax=unclassified Helicobacter TaxID=2593540 RepID=UPI000CF1C1A3|nr:MULTISPECIES: F0F1 ATP synthase subunit delta [unclassified Helicobacter]
MLNTIAKRYAKAVLGVLDSKELETLLQKLEIILFALKEAKFLDMMESPYIDFKTKQKILFDIAKVDEEKIQNLLSLILENKRIRVLPYLYEELQYFLNEKNKTYQGVIYAKEMLDSESVAKIQNKLAKHLNVTLELSCQELQRDEISLVVQGLGVEISFSNQRFLEGLKSHILKAI